MAIAGNRAASYVVRRCIDVLMLGNLHFETTVTSLYDGVLVLVWLLHSVVLESR
jgi:uncharacterized membrane protein